MLDYANCGIKFYSVDVDDTLSDENKITEWSKLVKWNIITSRLRSNKDHPWYFDSLFCTSDKANLEIKVWSLVRRHATGNECFDVAPNGPVAELYWIAATAHVVDRVTCFCVASEIDALQKKGFNCVLASHSCLFFFLLLVMMKKNVKKLHLHCRNSASSWSMCERGLQRHDRSSARQSSPCRRWSCYTGRQEGLWRREGRRRAFFLLFINLVLEIWPAKLN